MVPWSSGEGAWPTTRKTMVRVPPEPFAISHVLVSSRTLLHRDAACQQLRTFLRLRAGRCGFMLHRILHRLSPPICTGFCSALADGRRGVAALLEPDNP